MSESENALMISGWLTCRVKCSTEIMTGALENGNLKLAWSCMRDVISITEELISVSATIDPTLVADMMTRGGVEVELADGALQLESLLADRGWSTEDLRCKTLEALARHAEYGEV